MDSNTNFNFTKPAIIIPTVSGSISFISSMLIIYVILKSPKLVFSTPYHRIMFGLSIGDCIISLAIALTTIPMPRDVIYPFAQSSYGNIATCNAQAYAQIGGSGATFGMSVVLYIYYGCSLVFHMKNVTFRKWIETPMVIFLLLLFLAPLFYSDNEEGHNPSPTSVYCTRREYPDKCTKDTDSDCREEGRGNFSAFWVNIALVTFVVLIIDMCLIVFSFYRAERKLKAQQEDNNSTASDIEIFVDDELKEIKGHKRRITKEALMYIASFFAIWIFAVLYADLVESKDSFKDIPVLAALRYVFQPLQGFLNMLIFFYHKMEILKGKDEHHSLSFRERFKMVLLHPEKALEEKKMVISNLPMLGISSASNEQTELPEDAITPSEEKPDESLSPSKMNLYSDLGMTSLASSSRGINRNDTDKFHLSLSQGESLASSFEYDSGYYYYNEVRKQDANGDFVESQLQSRCLHSVEEEESDEEDLSNKSR
ncbi:hypothetical protein CTEN210_02802 [Chaetoceros tenuissimus]|uniref:G-protein coupled receptors family 1 profile domain-containing protein n=1 Tax=Chaetoceros tenuissimus TaxID=426638 RepID=A0AAD3CI72_9STRA|nr:hypothetical protein CTEN210_02802 [Chaetoceros tenuissimus]